MCWCFENNFHWPMSFLFAQILFWIPLSHSLKRHWINYSPFALFNSTKKGRNFCVKPRTHFFGRVCGEKWIKPIWLRADVKCVTGSWPMRTNVTWGYKEQQEASHVPSHHWGFFNVDLKAPQRFLPNKIWTQLGVRQTGWVTYLLPRKSQHPNKKSLSLCTTWGWNK